MGNNLSKLVIQFCLSDKKIVVEQDTMLCIVWSMCTLISLLHLVSKNVFFLYRRNLFWQYGWRPANSSIVNHRSRPWETQMKSKRAKNFKSYNELVKREFVPGPNPTASRSYVIIPCRSFVVSSFDANRRDVCRMASFNAL